MMNEPMPLSRQIGIVEGLDWSTFDIRDDGGFDAILEPIIAGARARGVADGLEMIGVGAVLLDETGKVLHVGGRGRRMMGGHARIAGDHFVAERGADNAAIQNLVGGAIGAGPHDPQLRVRIGVDRIGEGLTIRAVRFDGEEGRAQRLRAVVILERDRED